MTRFHTLFLSMIAMALMALSAPVLAEKPADAGKDKAQDKAAKADAKDKAAKANAAKKDEGPKFSPHYNALVHAAGLDEAQQVELRKILDERDARRKEIREARKATEDKEKNKQLRADARASEQAAEASMMALLKPEQAQAWRAYQLYFRQSMKHGKANMDQAQKDKAHAIAKQVAQKHKVDASTDAKTLNVIYAEYLGRVSEEVLSEEQWAALVKKPKAKEEKAKENKADAAKEKKADKAKK